MSHAARIIHALALFALLLTLPAVAASKAKFKGYVTSRTADTLQILDDIVHLTPITRFEVAGGTPDQLAAGMMIEAEGIWTGKHQFAAEKITCDASQFEKEIHESAYLDRDPGGGALESLKVDGESLLLNEKARKAFDAAASSAGSPAQEAGGLLGLQVKYSGLRRSDGSLEVRELEFGSLPPAEAREMPGGRKLVKARDPQTAIDVLEFRHKKTVEGRLKLFPVLAVQDYVAALGTKMLPALAGRKGFAEIEFRFYVIEDSSINAFALPDGAIVVTTALLGAVANESQLAFALSHEVAHVLQAHAWRHEHETRSKRILITIAAAAASAYIGNVATFLGQLGVAAVVNGFSRRIENQADRIALQNVIDKGYDPREAIGLFRTLIDKYSNRSTSVLWSNHDSAIQRGSFLTVQIARQYPDRQFQDAVPNNDGFQAMREALGPVKIE